ncbi:acetate kinase [Allokutzneria sp. A3M-2-11 16]|uniref:acetate/propionate family kinase n=1 Tax=Allokutzneria sp. A3M-2-11 16 TaxID=2962043 RepID=UPI0020B8BD36|nr:acetate kinase [Allokutzneria sp. A3M-2-11 16]MCP3803899.1 acetate kinase [Allokutzneria sp. A3M-2-11 16]
MSTVLTINPGSSSLQAHVIDDDHVIDSMHVEQRPETDDAVRELEELLSRNTNIEAVGHRIVHGGPDVIAPTIVSDSVVDAVREFASLAPLHVPASLTLLDKLREKLAVPHVLCPDTAFHSGLPKVAATYPLPKEWRERFGLRRYGFHGLSYGWAISRAAEELGRPARELSVLLAHLGGGSSVCAFRDGRSVDTSMGFTPLEGLPMAKRSGSVDPGMLLWLLRENKLGLDELSEGLHTRSGLLGLGGSPDTRDLVKAAAEGDMDADLALRVFAHRASRELAAAATSLDRIDALVFTGEIGWDQPEVREAIVDRLGVLGKIRVLVVEPREEVQIYRDTVSAIAG